MDRGLRIARKGMIVAKAPLGYGNLLARFFPHRGYILFSAARCFTGLTSGKSISVPITKFM